MLNSGINMQDVLPWCQSKAGIAAFSNKLTFQSHCRVITFKQSPRGVLNKRCSENMQQIYRRTPMPKCNFIELAPRHGCSPVNLLHIFKTPFLRNTFGWLLPYFLLSMYKLIHSEHKERTSSPGSDWTSIYLTYT